MGGHRGSFSLSDDCLGLYECLQNQAPGGRMASKIIEVLRLDAGQILRRSPERFSGWPVGPGRPVTYRGYGVC